MKGGVYRMLTLDAVRTLNSLVAALSVNDGDYYDAIDIAFEEIRE